MNLRALQKHWNFFGQRGPLSAILAHPGDNGAGWDTHGFFQSGVSEIEAVLWYVESIHPLLSKKCALDFGCGVGRLTQALALHFEQVHGVDISPAMIEHARSYNQHGNRCNYLLNETGDLRILPGGHFDFIYSNITLQHMPPRFAKQYIAEFIRVLSPGGVLVFQLPSRWKGKFNGIRSLARRLNYRILHPRTPFVVMRGIHREEVVRLLAAHGGQVLDIVPDESAGPSWESFRYLVKR